MTKKKSKRDLYKEFKAEYITPKQPEFVVIGPAKYLAISGQGAPGGEQFRSHISALYAVAYALKMSEKFAGHDYKVCHLEGQWWAENGSDFHVHQPKTWQWRLLIRVPEFITRTEVETAMKSVLEKRKSTLVSEVKLEELTEGRCVQMLHIGPYGEERTTIEKMQALAADNGVHLRGPHHEIYLSDPNRVPPQRLRTILRYPVE
ncbi:MAG TPA: GyrI-like domain-containing protein [Candidatus Binatia bacterium]|nr:GyrI-like domain-containing protein [Candidatus Binatia bacterium]